MFNKNFEFKILVECSRGLKVRHHPFLFIYLTYSQVILYQINYEYASKTLIVTLGIKKAVTKYVTTVYYFLLPLIANNALEMGIPTAVETIASSVPLTAAKNIKPYNKPIKVSSEPCAYFLPHRT